MSELGERPPHGGYPGEVVVQDEYLECIACQWAFPLEYGESDCSECWGLLEVRRAHPAPESTLRMELHV